MLAGADQQTSALEEARRNGRVPWSMLASRELEKARYRVPQEGRSARLAFVGQSTYFEHCALEQETAGIEPAFIDFRSGADPERMLAAVEAFEPHVVFVFRPEIVPRALFRELRALTVGYLTEPLPRPGEKAHPDLERRLGYLEELDAANFDRIISFDPLIAETVDRFAPVWRSFPLPVADSFYAPVRRSSGAPRALFVGRSTVHRDLFLDPVKHKFDVIHLVHGISDERLIEFFGECEIAINLHNHAYPTFENRVSLSLAAGMLVMSEALSPTHGLEPGVDFLQVWLPWELEALLFNATHYPDLYRRVRIRGRHKAERFRASAVYPRLVMDLLLDFAAFGTERPPP
jgi:hypothetical protein